MFIQAVVDHEYIFKDICVGSVHDPRIFVNSSMYKRITVDNILNKAECRTILGKSILLISLVIQRTHGYMANSPSLTPEFNYRLLWSSS